MKIKIEVLKDYCFLSYPIRILRIKSATMEMFHVKFKNYIVSNLSKSFKHFNYRITLLVTSPLLGEFGGSMLHLP